jgi:DNA repair protein RadA/Sms
VVTGIDANRVAMVLAVLAQRCKLNMMDREVYAATVGGMKIVEPAADLATALALASTVKGRPLPSGLVAVGEVGLGGEVRRVPDLRFRLAEAARLGFTVAVVPRATNTVDQANPRGLRVIPVETLSEALATFHLNATADRTGEEDA